MQTEFSFTNNADIFYVHLVQKEDFWNFTASYKIFFLSEEINVEGKCGQEKFDEAMDEAGKQNVGY